MVPMKSPGLDRFNACFFQTYWKTIGDEVCTTMLNFLNGGAFNDHINHTYIVLVSKVKNSVKVSDFRSISLCNVIYKLGLKVLYGILKKILMTIISNSQSAFILIILIMDNVIVAYKALHSIMSRHKEKNVR